MKHHKGFTAIELVVAITIVLLLVAVAVASFHDHMTRKYRAEARKALAETAEWLQLQYPRTGTYMVKLPIPQVPSDGDARYRIELATSAITASDPKVAFPVSSMEAFTLRAVPVDETPCGSLLLDSNGRTGVSGEDARVADCWR
jgi:type IV pilus assembly protein PilE